LAFFLFLKNFPCFSLISELFLIQFTIDFRFRVLALNHRPLTCVYRRCRMYKKSFLLLLLILWAVPTFAADTSWVRRYNGPGNWLDGASDLALDNSCNVYVTGYTSSIANGSDYATIKYDSSGNQLWVRTYDGSEGGPYDDSAAAIDVDNAGNIYVTGISQLSETGFDYATIKYYPNGATAWVRRYNGPANMGDRATDIAVDDYGNVYVTGQSYSDETGLDYATIKYDPDGTELWVRRYNGPGDEDDGANAIVVSDGSGNVYVTGYSYIDWQQSEYATIGYYPNGDTAWVRRYNPGYGEDSAYAITLDRSGNIYVTGCSYAFGTDYDYATIKYYPNGDTAWVRRYNGPGYGEDYAYAIAVDTSGNVYVTGTAWSNGTEYDYATIKYDPDGNELWKRRYAGTWKDVSSAVTVDDQGNVYVTGWSYKTGYNYDYYTTMYDSIGWPHWGMRYNSPIGGSNWDEAHAIAVDDSGNVYVTGWSDFDFATIKYCPSRGPRGDANGDGVIDIVDVVYLLNYLFVYGPAPEPLETGDANCDGVVDVSDIVYLLNYLFVGGPAPGC
jgi:uncharacterized delta-60 repeat protein